MPDKLVYIHTKCGGEVSTNFITGRRCKKCGKKWNPVSFLFTMNEIRPVTIRVPYKAKKGVSHAKWGDKIPGVRDFINILPNWPRWARISVTVAFVVVVAVIIFLIRR